MKSRFCAKALCFLLVCLSLAAADSIELRNGRHIQGKYVGGTSTVIGFMTGATVEYFATVDVLALIFDRNPDSPLGGMQPETGVQPAPMKGDVPNEAFQQPQTSLKRNRRNARVIRASLATD